MSFGETDFLTIVDGKIVEEWVVVDMMGWMQQIGAIPANEHASGTARS